MRKSAITRIVLYSLLTVLLIGILGSFLAIHAGRGFGGFGRMIAAEVLDEADLDDLFEDEPDEDGSRFATASQGETLTFDGEAVGKIEIDWVAGDILVQKGDVEKIEVRETESDYPMVYDLREGKLEIRFSKNLRRNFADFRNLPDKDLTVTVPESWQGKELEIQSVSADAEIQGMTVENLEYQGVSGECQVQDCVVRELDVETVSGNVLLEGEVMELDCESVSADVTLSVTNVPRKIDMDGVSGRLQLTLPEDAGFTVDMNGLSKDLDTDFPVTTEKGKFVSGDGSCRIEIDGVSGNVKILKRQ